ncbi:hypothetical protein MEN41_23455 [Dolichospermum sp. ST_con]|nr:hypothetical protein [Dolichospermum sp. ST_con]MDD1419447.1 hypothetical protein [Dolichospermum sp. ST_sed1]MDD1429458.1 hypothetical protein [Dolichospermum sp. ST_sed9]MDD1430556.1 hypothetical protein [Dolichospermum sp. ST_sed6]MDD1435043.1 hypothetical protein [Dolichospermum sp. ST_sed10]MDD1439395.1 hypothetical protein [Dolichospermum sp. ST_sed3]MDD1445422.1 hypothetical protein [Dolichospermum sp. ST_sed8]MDD1458433.1 hypothetical protein [Dolichospermum sp. ST_sed7]MDD145883
MEGSIEHLIKGDVISVPFPFSDTSTTKKRPALVIFNYLRLNQFSPPDNCIKLLL